MGGERILTYLDKFYIDKEHEVVIFTHVEGMKEEAISRLQGYDFLDYTATGPTDIQEKNLTELIEKKAKILGVDLIIKTYDIVIITALKSEMEKVMEAFSTKKLALEIEKNIGMIGEWSTFTEENDPHVYKTTKLVNSSGGGVSIISAVATKKGMNHTAVLATKMILKFSPKVIVMLGVCAGNKDNKVKLNDIIIANKTFNYQEGKFSMDKDEKIKFQPDGNMLNLDVELDQVFMDDADIYTYNIARDWKKLYGGDNKNDPNVIIGPMGSGAAVVSLANVFEPLINQARDTVAIDMEAYAIFVASNDAVCKQKPIPLVIKGVQDYGDPDKTEDTIKSDGYSAYSSGMFFVNYCYDFLAKYLQPPKKG